MKRLLPLTLTALMVLGNISCTGNSDKATEEIIPFENADNEPPTQQRVAQLIEFLPDHEIIAGSESAFAPEYFELLQQAWAVPSDGIGEIGSDEWLYYFVSGNGGRDPNRTISIENIIAQGDGAEATFTITNYGVSIRHTLCLMKLNVFDKPNAEGKPRSVCTMLSQEKRLMKWNGTWVISDFDGTKIKLKEYIDRQRQYFQSDQWQDYLAPILAPDDEYSQQARHRIQEVKRWLQKQPTP